MRLFWRHRNPLLSRFHHSVLLGITGACAAHVDVRATPPGRRCRLPAPRASVAEELPVASGVRIAGDDKQTRFILDLDRKIDVRAFTLNNPYRVVLDIPQVTFNLPTGAGSSGRGLIQAFRYGLVMPGGSRLVFDLTGPAKIEKTYAMEAANGQPARLVLELTAVEPSAFKASSVSSAGSTDLPQLRPAMLADADANSAVPGIPPERPRLLPQSIPVLSSFLIRDTAVSTPARRPRAVKTKRRWCWISRWPCGIGLRNPENIAWL